MVLRSWEQGDDGADQQQILQHHEKQPFGDPSCNEKVGFQCQSGLLSGVKCRHHTSHCRCIKRRRWLHRARWCLLIVPLLFLGRRWNSQSENTCSRGLRRPLAYPQEPVYAMSNYSASALQPHIAYGASNAHAISVHANVVAANATCTLYPLRSSADLAKYRLQWFLLPFSRCPWGLSSLRAGFMTS